MQEILTYIILLITILYLIIRIVKFFVQKKHKDINSCSYNCSSCAFNNKLNTSIDKYTLDD